MTTRPLRWGAAGTALLALAACGSTVATTAGGATGNAALGASGGALPSGGSGDSGLSVPGGSSSGVGAGGSTTGGGFSSGTGGGTGAGSGTTSTGGTGSSSSGGSSSTGGSSGGTTPGASALGVTPTKVYIGVTYYTNGDAANAALGGSSLTQGDTKADAKAVIDDINAHGGINGRKLTPVYYGYDAQSQAPKANQDEAACAKFTQDNHVFLVVGGGLTDDFEACMTKHGILEANAGAIIDPDEATFRQHPQYFQAGTLAQERMMSDEVNTLQRLHYFTGWNTALGKPSPQTPVKVGIISIDIPQWERPLKSVLLPALGRIGHAPADADIIRVHNPNAASEDGATVSQIESAFFKFRSDGVTHVILLDASGSFLLIGAPTARGQNYYPRFGINSGSGAQAIYDNGTVTSKQLAGAVGLGWLPGLDLPANQGPKYATAATRQCLQNIERRTGQKFTSTNAEGLALSYCDEIGVLTFALRRITGPITLQNGISAMESVGSAYKPAGLPTSFYGPGRHDAVNTGFDLIWRTSCSCATYVGRHTIP